MADHDEQTGTISERFSDISFFDPDEFDRPELMAPKILRAIDDIRRAIKQPIYITSDWRDTGEHSTGLAVDISDNNSGQTVNSYFRYKVLRYGLYNLPTIRIGIYDRHIHIGLSDRFPMFPNPRVWWGVSD